MDKALIELIKHQPDWFYTLSAIIFLVLLIFIAWWAGTGAKRFSDAIGRENKIITLQDEIRTAKQTYIHEKNIAAQVKTAIENASTYVYSLNNIRFIDNPELRISTANQLMQRVIDGLASDIKFHPGEKHRCGIWMEDNNKLVLTIASSGFPENYLNQRSLELDHSIAGKSFRKKEIIHRNDVTIDDDWKPNKNSNSKYKAIIAIPLNGWGVLTIDALNPINEETILIGGLYSRIIEGAMDLFVESIRFGENLKEVAPTKSENDV